MSLALKSATFNFVTSRNASAGSPSRPRSRGTGLHRAALADVQPLANRRTKFVVLAFESSGWTDPTVQKLVNVGAAGFATFGSGSSTRHELSSEIQYWNLIYLILRLDVASKSP